MALNGAVAVSLVPEIAKLNIINNTYGLNKRINFSLFVTAFIIIPIMVGMFIYSDDIINLLFPNANKGGELLKLASFSIVFCGFSQTITGILQGIGEVNSYLKYISFSMIIKLILNLILIPIDNLLEKGALISSLIYDILIFILLYKKMKERLHFRLNILIDAIRIFLISIIAICFSKLLLNNIILSIRIKTIIEIFTVAIIYFVLSYFIFQNKNLKNILFNKKRKKLKYQ